MHNFLGRGVALSRFVCLLRTETPVGCAIMPISKNYLFLSLGWVLFLNQFFLCSWVRADLLQTGIAEPDYYTRVYDPETAYSDHAPVVYGKTLTWNITQQGRDQNGAINHKFSGILNEPDEFYHRRLKRVAAALDALFKKHSIQIGLLQELPCEVLESEQHREPFKRFLAKNQLTLIDDPTAPAQGVVVRSGSNAVALESARGNDKIADAIFTTRPTLTPKYHKLFRGTLKRIAAVRFQASDLEETEIHVSVHAKFGLREIDLCEIFQLKAQQLLSLAPKANTVFFTGDFNNNMRPEKIAEACEPFGILVSSTPGGRGYPSPSNQPDDPQDKGLVNIDLQFTYSKRIRELKQGK